MSAFIKHSNKIKEERAQSLNAYFKQSLDRGDITEEIYNRFTQTVNSFTIPKPGSSVFFVMIYPKQNLKVVRWINSNSKRPRKASEIWALLLCHMKPNTGEITLTRDQIAKEVDIRPSEVSQIMNELARFGAIFTKREKIPGLRGPGKVVYYMNKHVAETGSRATKDELSKIPQPGGLEND